jgi:hypothetical protein
VRLQPELCTGRDVPVGGVRLINYLCMWLIHEIWAFLKKRKRLWLFPLFVLMLLVGLLLLAAQSAVLAPFIYAIF